MITQRHGRKLASQLGEVLFLCQFYDLQIETKVSLSLRNFVVALSVCVCSFLHTGPTPSPSFPITGSSRGLLWGQSVPISGSSLRPCNLTPHFYGVCGCCAGSSVTPGHPHTQPHRHLVDISSIRADGGSALRCRSRSQRAGVKT